LISSNVYFLSAFLLSLSDPMFVSSISSWSLLYFLPAFLSSIYPCLFFASVLDFLVHVLLTCFSFLSVYPLVCFECLGIHRTLMQDDIKC
jgi:hypothetical protein